MDDEIGGIRCGGNGKIIARSTPGQGKARQSQLDILQAPCQSDGSINTQGLLAYTLHYTCTDAGDQALQALRPDGG
jgi:hypothetical protein